MPKSLEELKGFYQGIVSSPSTLDIPKESATYSLNIDSKLEQGALTGIYDSKILTETGWRDKRYSKWTLKFLAHSGSFNLDKYANKYFILETYSKTFLVWFDSSGSGTTYKNIGTTYSDEWDALLEVNPLLLELRIDINGLSTVSSVASKLKTETGISLGPSYGEFLYSYVASSWYTITQTNNTDGSTTLTYQSNFLGSIGSPSIDSGDYDDSDVYRLTQDYFFSEQSYFGTGLISNITAKWAHLFHEDDKETLALINKNNRFITSEDIYSTDNIFVDNNIIIPNSGINKITSENRNNNLYIGTGNTPQTVSKWFGRINRVQLERTYDNELVLEDSECYPPTKFADTATYDKIVVPTLHSGMNSTNSMIAGAASLYGTEGVGTDFGGDDVEVAATITSYRSLNGWVMKCLANASHAFQSDWSAADDTSNFDWTKSCKRGMILRVSIGQDGDSTCASVEQDSGGDMGAPAAGEAIYELRKIKEIGYGDTSAATHASEGVELHDGDLFQVVTVPASGADTLAASGATSSGNVNTYPRLMYVGSLLGNSSLHNSTTAYIPAPAWSYAMKNGSSDLTRISLSETRDSIIASENQMYTFSTSGATGNLTDKYMFKQRETSVNLSNYIPASGFSIGTISECMSSDGLGGVGGRTGKISELATNAIAVVDTINVKFTTTVTHSYQLGDWVTISNSHADHNGLHQIIDIPSTTTFTIYTGSVNVSDTAANVISANRNYYAGHGKLWVTSDNPEHFDRAWIVDVVNWHGLDEDNERISVKEVRLQFGRIHERLISNESGHGLLDKGVSEWGGEGWDGEGTNGILQAAMEAWEREPSNSYISGICETYSHQPHLDDGASSGNGTGSWRVWFSYSKKNPEEAFSYWDLFLFNIRPTEINDDYLAERVWMFDKTPPYQNVWTDGNTVLGKMVGGKCHFGIHTHPTPQHSNFSNLYWYSYKHPARNQEYHTHVELGSDKFLHAGAGKQVTGGDAANYDVYNHGSMGMHFLLSSYEKDDWSTDDYPTISTLLNPLNKTARGTGKPQNVMFFDPSGMWHVLESPTFRTTTTSWETTKLENAYLNFGSDLGWSSTSPRLTKPERHCLIPFFNQWYWTYSEAEQTYEDWAGDVSGGTSVAASKVAHIVTFFGRLEGLFAQSIAPMKQSYVGLTQHEYYGHSCYFKDGGGTYYDTGEDDKSSVEYNDEMSIFHMHDSPVAFAPAGSDSVTGSTTTSWGGNEIQGRPSIANDDAGTGDVRADYKGNGVDIAKHSVRATLGYSKWNQYRYGHDHNGTHSIDTDDYTSTSNWNTWGGYIGADGYGHYNMVTITWDSGDIGYSPVDLPHVGGGRYERHGIHRYRHHNSYIGYNLNGGRYGLDVPVTDGNDKTYTFSSGGEGTGYFTWYANKDQHINTTSNGVDTWSYGTDISYKTRGYYPSTSSAIGGNFHYDNADLDTSASTHITGSPWNNRRINRCWSTCHIGEGVDRMSSGIGGRLMVNPRCTFKKLEGWSGSAQGPEENWKYKKLYSVDLAPFYETKTQSRTDNGASNVMRPGIVVCGEIENTLNQYTKVMVLDPLFWGAYNSDSSGQFGLIKSDKVWENTSYAHMRTKSAQQAVDGYAIVAYYNKKLVMKNLCHSIFAHSVNYDVYSPIISGFNVDNSTTGLSTWRKSTWPEMAIDQANSFGTEFPHYIFNRFYNMAGVDAEACFGLDNCGSSGSLNTTISERYPTQLQGSRVGAGSDDDDTVTGSAGDAASNLKTSIDYPINTLPEPNPLGTTDVSEFAEGDLIQYRFSYLYDGYQDSPMAPFVHTHNGAGTEDVLAAAIPYINVEIKIPSAQSLQINKRVTHIVLWRRNNTYDQYRLVKQIDLSNLKNINRDEEGNFIINHRDEKTFESFENLTGFSESINSTGINFSLSAQVNDNLFIADCHHKEMKDASFMLFKSVSGKFSVFNWISDFLALPKKPLALASFGGKLYVFTRENLYRVNPDSLFIENVMKGVGILNQNSVVVTDFGMFFCDANNMYQHDGTQPKAIGSTVLYNQSNPEWSIGYKRALDKALKEGYTPLVEFDGRNNVVYFIIQGYSEGVSSYKNTSSRCYAYDITTGRFDYLDMPAVTVTASGRDSDTLLFDNYQIYSYRRSDSIKKSWSWDSKVFDMGSLALKKVWKSIKLAGCPTIANLNGDSSDDVLVYIEGVQKNMTIENKNWNASKPIAGFTADQNWNAGTGADTGAIYALAAALPGSGETVDGMTNSNSFALLTTSMPEFVSGEETVQIDPITEGEIDSLKYISPGQYLLMEITHNVTTRSIKEIVKVSAINFIWNTNNTISRVEVKCERGQLGTQAFDFQSALLGDYNWEHASLRYIGPSLRFPTATKGSSMQIKFKNQKGFIDSISFVYRDKTLK